MLYQNLDALTGFAESHFPERMAEQRDHALNIVAELVSELEGGAIAPLAILDRDHDLGAMMEMADYTLGWARQIVLLGTGGSSLGPQALARFQGLTGPSSDYRQAGIRWFFPDNLDGQELALMFGGLPLDSTLFLVVSKSGSTLETMMQAAFAEQALSSAGLEIKKHMLVITEPKESPLSRYAAANRLSCLPHDEDIGGRYAMFSNVGMFPAMLMGLDPRRLRRAASEVVQQFVSRGIDDDVARSAMACEVLQREGYTSVITYLYADALTTYGSWFRQLWAESVGKSGSGMLPDVVLGPVGQHSQLQLHLDGPADKIFTMISTTNETGMIVPASEALQDVLHLVEGMDVGEVVRAQAEATGDALTARGCPVRRILLDGHDPEDLMRLMASAMLETIMAARLADTDPFDQPAVEEGKSRLRHMLAERKPTQSQEEV